MFLYNNKEQMQFSYDAIYSLFYKTRVKSRVLNNDT